MSLAPPDWQKQFVDSKEDEIAWESEANKLKTSQPQWADNWRLWSKAKQDIKDTGKYGQLLKENKFIGLTDEERRIAAQMHQSRLAKTAHMASKIAGFKAQLKEATKEAVDRLINSAIFGAEDGKGEIQKGAAGDAAGRSADACNTGGSIKGKETIDYALMCLCLGAGGGEAPKPCDEEATASVDWARLAGNAKTGYDAVRALCPKAHEEPIAAAEIRQALADLRRKIKLNTNVGYLGFYATTGCNGSSGSGICINYNNKITNTKNDYDKLHFVQQLTQGANLLEQPTAAKQAADLWTSKLEGEAKEAWLTPSTAITLAKKSKAVLTQAEQSKTFENKKKECEQHKDNKSACENTGNCRWEEEKDGKGECKPKPGTETTAAAAGEQAKEGAAATTGCTKHGTDKDKCENDKSCKWENNACKDSSILLNKKFALSMVSAAFVALLF
uniref:Variant surface glycoprotein 1125.46 n=1 Tax=Trypanosoma brucei TaxID=5691 RepID=M4SYU0_9TRYP|nr:variant surface glycoprotein 2075 [Trypanosoma brucei]APD72597.1 variant surface glycoprotein 1125.46 [Trypanosoma brucei]